MPDDKTPPPAGDSTNPISRVESRVVPRQSVRFAAVEPCMIQARRTLSALVASAANPPMRLQGDFNIVGLGHLHTQALENFCLVDDNSADVTRFTVSFEYRGREPLKHLCNSDQTYDALRKSLFGHGLVFRSAESATASKLTIEPVVSAAVTIATERGRDTVKVTLNNIIMLGTTEYELPIERLDRKLIDALVELITSHDKTFYTLVRSAPGST